MDLQTLIKSQLSEQLIRSMAQQAGIENSEKAQAAAGGLIQTLIAGIGRNAKTQEGASALASALERDHDGSVLDDVQGMLSMINPEKPSAPNKALDGAGILGHVLGGKQSQVFSGLSKSLGVDEGSLGKMAVQLAPLVMGALGKTKRQNNLGANDLSNLLGSVLKGASGAEANQLSLVESLLDSDGDGDIKDDLINHGMKLFSSFMKKR